MSKKRKPDLINEPIATIGGRTLKPGATSAKPEGSSENMNANFSFLHVCSNHFQLHEWQHEELKGLISKLREVSGKTWSEIRKLKGFGPVDPATFSQQLPPNISADVTIYELRTSGKARLFGHRVHNVFHIIWFDRNHQVYPM